jgi:hypothetical protein
MLSPNSCASYFKLGSATRRHSVIGCTGYENANPPICIPETADIGVGCHNEDDGDNVDSCAICFEPFHQGCTIQKNVATTECGHTFCLSCLLKNLHISNVCPLCRAPIEKDEKQKMKSLSYSEGIGLLDHELNGLRILEEVEQFVQNAVEISSQPNTNGQNVQDVIDSVMNMVTNFGFNLLYDATLHTTGSEEHMDPDWLIQMYNDDSDDSSMSDSSMNDSDDSTLDDESDLESSESDDDDGNDNDESESESENKRIMLPEVPESMLE